jgi:anti-sigma B factor antagonist
MPNNKLTIDTLDSGNPALKIVELGGSLTLETVASFNQTLREDAAPMLLVDLSKLEWLDSAGVGALVQLLVRREKVKNSMAISGLSPRNNAVLQVAQVLRLFSVFPTAADAQAHFAKNGTLSSGASA